LFTAIDHIVLNCHDVAAQEAFFAGHFGFPTSRTRLISAPNGTFHMRTSCASVLFCALLVARLRKESFYAVTSHRARSDPC
jgi:catechol 2,3-dioxygenase-like lactoylglutathione lyase family enzyme